MGITKCNTMDAIWLLELRCPDDFGGGACQIIHSIYTKNYTLCLRMISGVYSL